MKKIWILNHYASTMFVSQGGRHHWFAKNLLDHDYETKIFCSNQVHNSKEEISTDNQLFTEKLAEDIPYVFVKSTKYQRNNIKRVLNIITFTINLIRTLKRYIKSENKPDVIIASSVHPLTWYVGYRTSKKYKIPLIIEVRDLWPESLVAYGYIKQGSIMSKIFYSYELWAYKKADSIIMTIEGGKTYIKDKKWATAVDTDKIHYIPNGYDEASFEKTSINWYKDEDLINTNLTKVVYTGSVREVNDLDIIVETALLAKHEKIPICFLIFGDGDQRERLIQKCMTKNIHNIIFKGPVDKMYIPSILKQSDIILIHNKSTLLDRYGQSQNKLFEAIASEKPIIQTYHPDFSPLDNYVCGFMMENQSVEELLNTIKKTIKIVPIVPKLSDDYKYHYEFKHLTSKLINIIHKLV